jgi:hypothetical protein
VRDFSLTPRALFQLTIFRVHTFPLLVLVLPELDIFATMENLPNQVLYQILSYLTPGQETINLRFDKSTQGFQAGPREITADIISFGKTQKRA